LKYLVWIFVIFTVTFLLAGCKSRQDQTEQEQTQTEQIQVQQPKPEQDSTVLIAVEPYNIVPIPKVQHKVDSNDIVATVNDVIITAEQLQATINNHKAPRQQQIPETFNNQFQQELREKCIDTMIVDILLEQEIKKHGISVSKEEIVSRFNAYLADTLARNKWTISDFEEHLLAQGSSIKEYRLQIKRNLEFEKLIDSEIGSVEVTYEELIAYYRLNQDDFKEPEELRVSQILIGVDPNEPDEDKAQARAKAENLLEKLKDGEDFAELARRYSNCPSSSRGGDLGFVSKKYMPSEFGGSGLSLYFGQGSKFKKVVFSLDVGQVSDIVESWQGYHIIKVTEKKQPQYRDFDDVREDIIKNLKFVKRMKLVSQYLDTLKQNAEISISEAYK